MNRILATLFALPVLAITLTVPGIAGSTSKVTAAQHAAAIPDSQIDATIRTKLAKSKIGKDGFKFHVQRGVVTWEGTTNVVQHKGSATRMAKAAGATQVINNIAVSASAKAKASANLKKAYVEP
jgi:cell division protein FtsX